MCATKYISVGVLFYCNTVFHTVARSEFLVHVFTRSFVVSFWVLHWSNLSTADSWLARCCLLILHLCLHVYSIRHKLYIKVTCLWYFDVHVLTVLSMTSTYERICFRIHYLYVHVHISLMLTFNSWLNCKYINCDLHVETLVFPLHLHACRHHVVACVINGCLWLA